MNTHLLGLSLLHLLLPKLPAHFLYILQPFICVCCPVSVCQCLSCALTIWWYLPKLVNCDNHRPAWLGWGSDVGVERRRYLCKDLGETVLCRRKQQVQSSKVLSLWDRWEFGMPGGQKMHPKVQSWMLSYLSIIGMIRPFIPHIGTWSLSLDGPVSFVKCKAWLGSFRSSPPALKWYDSSSLRLKL